MLSIGRYKLDNQVALAPMAGVTDLPFRRLCRTLGAGLVVSEMITSDTRLWDTRKSSARLQHDAECEPRSVQIAGADPEMMAAAAIENVARGAQIIDINMGCPAKKVCRKAAGSALLRDEALVARILTAVVSAVDVPVTLKIRTGWSPQERNGVSIARLAEKCGIAALAVHGRTRACRFNGSAEYQTIHDICQAVELPVFANGDIDSPERARQVLNETGAAGVMIGRAAQGRPWLPGQIARYLEDGALLPDPTREQQWQILDQHLTDLHLFYGEYSGLRIARKHVGWYLQGSPRGDSFRKHFNQLESAAAQRALLHEYFNTQTNNKEQFKELAA